MLFYPKRNQIGMEYCVDEIRAVHVTATQKQVRINSSAIVEINRTTLKHQLAGLLEIRRLLNYRHTAVVFAIGHNEVITTTIEVAPQLKDKAIAMYLQAQAMHIFGHVSKELIIDYQVIGTTSETRQTLQVFATQRQHIMQIITLCKQSRITLRAIEVDVLAIKRALTLVTPTIDNQKNIGIILLQARKLTLTIIHNHICLYSITIDYPQRAVNTVNVITACRRALQFFSQAKPTHTIKSLMLSGEKKYLQATAHALTTERAYSVSIMDLAGSQLQVSALDTRLAVSVGAALWKIRS